MTPDFFIAGAAKCGTTSLDQYLAQHPDIFMAPIKESHFFAIADMPEHFTGPGDQVYQSNLIRSESAYEQMFQEARSGQAIGESSVSYLYYPGVAKRIYDANPQAKIIIMLRNPVERAYSAYMHMVRDGRETLSFAEGLREEPRRREMNYQPLWYYHAVGEYYEKVKRYLDTFGPKQVKIVWYQEFQKDPQQSVREVLSFLGVDPAFSIDTSVRYNLSGVPKGIRYKLATGSNLLTAILKPLIPESARRKLRRKAIEGSLEKQPMPEGIRSQLQQSFQPDVRLLQGLLGKDLHRWYEPSTSH